MRKLSEKDAAKERNSSAFSLEQGANMTFGRKGTLPKIRVEMMARRGRRLTRHPYVAALLFVMVATLCVSVVDQFFQFAPLIMFAAAAGVCFPVLGTRPGVFAVSLSALISDFFFVEPLLVVTRHTVVLGAYYGIFAGISRLVARNSACR